MSVAPVDPTQQANMSVIDMRSDTVTKPSAAMRAAMANAPVGDDVFGDDPSVNALQAQAAALLGKEAALLVPSGTMANLISLLVHVDARGGEMIVGDQSHIHFYEQGNAAQFGGIHSRVVRNQADGTLLLAEVEAAIRPVGDDHLPLTQLICIENTHNRCGGRVLGVEYMDELAALAKRHGLKLHVDGARLMNAAVKLGVPAARLVAGADSVSLCLSKGLSAPIGSLIVGSAEFIRRARRLRKALGGGMRQAGVLAAAGSLALTEQVPLLVDDHRRLQTLVRELSGVSGLLPPPCEQVETNIAYVKLDPSVLDCNAPTLVAELRARGLLITASDTMTVRFVAHCQVDDKAMDSAVSIVKDVIAQHRKPQQ